MGKKVLGIGWGIIGISVILAVGTMVGCDRNEPPPPAQTAAPAVTPQPAQPQTAAPAPSAPPAQAPVQAQQAAPAIPATQPVPAPAPSQTTAQENFSQVQMGMTSQQVLQLLGNPTKIKQKHQEVEWEYYTSQGKFELEFQMDKVVKIEKH